MITARPHSAVRFPSLRASWTLTLACSRTIAVRGRRLFAPTAGSLIDGFYDLTIDATKVSNTAGQLDGDNDFQPGGNYSVVGNTTNKFFRLFGDGNGNQDDFIAFRNAFNGGPLSIFDFEG